jgi:hypothetical protein
MTEVRDERFVYKKIGMGGMGINANIWFDFSNNTLVRNNSRSIILFLQAYEQK